MTSLRGSLELTSVPLFNVQNVGKWNESKRKHQEHCCGVVPQADALDVGAYWMAKFVRHVFLLDWDGVLI